MPVLVIRESAELASLELEFPFGRLRLSESGRWNANEQDSGKFHLSVTNLPEAAALLREVTGLPIEGVGKGGALELTASVSRDRGAPDGRVPCRDDTWTGGAERPSVRGSSGPRRDLPGPGRALLDGPHVGLL